MGYSAQVLAFRPKKKTDDDSGAPAVVELPLVDSRELEELEKLDGLRKQTILRTAEAKRRREKQLKETQAIADKLRKGTYRGEVTRP